MAKRIVLATIGTQGDVQPYVALALGLKQAGYDVVLAAAGDFSRFVTGYGIEFADLGRSIQELISQPRFQQAISGAMLLQVPDLLRQLQGIVVDATRRTWEISQGAEAIVLNMNTSFGVDIAEALDIPVIMGAPQPLNTTGEFPLLAYQGPTFGGSLNRLSYQIMQVQQSFYNLPRNRLRQQLMGLPRRRSGKFFHDAHGHLLPTLYCYSSLVAPRPADWPDSSVITGYWRLFDNTGWEPSPEFQAFLDSGPAPVYIGFGSMPFGAERNTQILKDALARWGGRAVVARGWGGIDPSALPSTVYSFDKAPHDKLFTHVSAVIHHGGAGTTSAGLHLGKPTFVIPQTVDQPYWGARVHAMGCGPAPIPLKKLTPEALTANLIDVSTNPGYRIAAASLAEKLNEENGVAKAVVEMERVMAAYAGR